MDFPMVLAGVDDIALRGRQQVSRQQIEKLLKKTLRCSGYVVANRLGGEDYILNLYDRDNRSLDEKTFGFQVKKGGKAFWVFYRHNGTMAIFQKDYIEDCMKNGHPAPYFRKDTEVVSEKA